MIKNILFKPNFIILFAVVAGIFAFSAPFASANTCNLGWSAPVRYDGTGLRRVNELANVQENLGGLLPNRAYYIRNTNLSDFTTHTVRITADANGNYNTYDQTLIRADEYTPATYSTSILNDSFQTVASCDHGFIILSNTTPSPTPVPQVSCDLSFPGTGFFVGDNINWTVLSAPQGYNAFQYRSINNIPDFINVFEGVTNFNQNYTFLPRDVGTYSTYFALRDGHNNLVCTTNTVFANIQNRPAPPTPTPTPTQTPTPSPGQCSLDIGKQVNLLSVQSGDLITYTLNFRNVGNGNCTGGVRVKDIVSQNLSFLFETHTFNVLAGYGSEPLYNAGTRTLSWDAQTLMPGDFGSVSWTAKVNQAQACGNFDLPNAGSVIAATTSWVNSNTVHTTVIPSCAAPTPTLTPTPNPGSVPIVQTNSATNISQNYATLNGAVNPNSSNTTYWFEYGTSFSLGSSTVTQNAGSGNSSNQVSYSLNFLSSNTTYYFRIVAQNQYGTSQGSILSFSTSTTGFNNFNQGGAPFAQTNSATNLYQTSATLNGQANANNSDTTYWFEYGTGQFFGNSTVFQSLGSGNYSNNVSAYVYNLVSNTTYYFRLVARNQYGTSYGQTLTFSTGYGYNYNGNSLTQTNPATSIGQNSAILNGQVTVNNSYYGFGNFNATQTWFEYGVNPNNLSFTTSPANVGYNYYSSNYNYNNASQTVYNLTPGTTYYFRVVARDQSNTTYGQILSFTTGGGNYYNYGQQPSVTTVSSRYVSQNSALLSGSVVSNGSATTAWFEYGSNYNNLGLRTADQNIGSGGAVFDFSTPLSGLSPNTTYYFRAAAQNQYGISYGSTLNFQTSSEIINYQTPIPYPTSAPPQQSQPPTIIYRTVPSSVVIREGGLSSGPNCVTLSPSITAVDSINLANLKPLDRFTYNLVYKNGCSADLSNVAVKITLPAETRFISTDTTYTLNDHVITYNLGTVARDVQAAINVGGQVENNTRKGDTLIFGAILSFNDTRGAFQTVGAYITTILNRGANSGLAFIFGALGGWGWPLLLALLLIVGLVFYLIFFKEREQEEQRKQSAPIPENYNAPPLAEKNYTPANGQGI